MSVGAMEGAGQASGDSGSQQASTSGAGAAAPSSSQGAQTQTGGESGKSEGKVSGVGAIPGGEVTPPVFTPNYKFKVHDQEHEIPEFLRGVVKDEATEKQLRETFEKAYGLDVVKPKLEKTRLDLQTERTQHNDLRSKVDTLGMYIRNQDFDSFFEALKLPTEAIFGWVNNKLQERELPPHVQAQVQQARQIQRQNYLLEQQNRELSAGAMSHSEQAKLTDLQSAVSAPEVKAVADAFDKRLGKPGSFVREVVKRAALVEQLERRDLTAQEAVAEVLAVLGPMSAPQQEAASGAFASSQQQPGAQQGTGTKAPPPVIPHVGGKHTSPTKKLAKSIDDLKRMAAEM